MANALRRVSGAFAGAIASSVTSPSPAASMSLSAASSANSSLPLTTDGDPARSSRPSGPRRSAPDAGSGTGLVRMTMRTKNPLPGGCSFVPAEQCPGDDQSLDLLRALVELGDLRVAHHPLDGEFVDVAVTAQDLDGVG